jgi:hypothetical protein
MYFVVVLLVPALSLTDQELYQQQQNKLVQLGFQLEKLKQTDSYSFQSTRSDFTTLVGQFENEFIERQDNDGILVLVDL